MFAFDLEPARGSPTRAALLTGIHYIHDAHEPAFAASRPLDPTLKFQIPRAANELLTNESKLTRSLSRRRQYCL